MNLRGEFSQRRQFNAIVLPSKLRIENQVLDAQPLALRLFDGTATLRGHADFNDPENATLRFAVNARGLKWGGADTTAEVTGAGGARHPGDYRRRRPWHRRHAAGLGRDRQGHAHPRRRTRAGAVRRARQRFAHDAEDAACADAERRTRCTAATSPGLPALSWNLDATLAGFDPGYFAPDWKGALRGKFTTRGETRDDGGLDIAVDAPHVDGRLRGRPLNGRGHFVMHAAANAQAQDAFEGEVAMTLGGSRIDAKGKVTDTLDVDASFAPLQLNDLLPDGAGTLRGKLKLSGARNAPNIDADLIGSGLSYAGYRADTISAHGRLPWRAGAQGAIAIRASGLDIGTPIEALTLDARGAVENLQLSGEARGEIGTLAFNGHASKRGSTWQGALASLRLAPVKGAQWQLQQAAQFRWDRPRWRLVERLPGVQRRRLAVREWGLAAPWTGRACRRAAAHAGAAVPARARGQAAMAAARRHRAHGRGATGRQQLARAGARHLR